MCFFYFMNDVPHLIKTSGNYLFNFGAGRYNCYMRNDVIFNILNHIVNLF